MNPKEKGGVNVCWPEMTQDHEKWWVCLTQCQNLQVLLPEVVYSSV
jgi:hypothetical protein